MIDSTTGTFRIRATGESRRERQAQAQHRRDVPPPRFLDFLYFTDYERPTRRRLLERQPGDAAQANCGDKYRAQRDGAARRSSSPTGDKINGPLHTNDDLLICGTPTFGREQRPTDRDDRAGAAATRRSAAAAGDDPMFNGTQARRRKPLTMPPTNRRCRRSRTAGGLVYTGKTIIRFNTAAT